MSPRIWFPNVDYLKLWEKGETRLNTILIIIISRNRNSRIDHDPIRPDRSLLIGRQTYKWSLWDVVFHENNSTLIKYYYVVVKTDSVID